MEGSRIVVDVLACSLAGGVSFYDYANSGSTTERFLLSLFKTLLSKKAFRQWLVVSCFQHLSNDPGKVDSNFFCYAATVLSPRRNVLIFTQRMHKAT